MNEIITQSMTFNNKYTITNIPYNPHSIVSEERYYEIYNYMLDSDIYEFNYEDWKEFKVVGLLTVGSVVVYRDEFDEDYYCVIKNYNKDNKYREYELETLDEIIKINADVSSLYIPSKDNVIKQLLHINKLLKEDNKKLEEELS